MVKGGCGNEGIDGRHPGSFSLESAGQNTPGEHHLGIERYQPVFETKEEIFSEPVVDCIPALRVREFFGTFPDLPYRDHTQITFLSGFLETSSEMAQVSRSHFIIRHPAGGCSGLS